MKLVLLTVAVLVALLGPQAVHSFPGGAPSQACDDLTPRGMHAAPQTTEVPYFVYLDPLCNNGYLMYTPGQTYTLGVRPTVAGDAFRGFFVQSRLVADDSFTGTFGVASVNESSTELSACTPTTAGITHSSNIDKNGIYFMWTAPENGTGPVVFAFAVVRTRDVTWADQRSAMVPEAGDVNATRVACPAAPPSDGAPQLNSIGFFSVLVAALAVAIKTAL